MNDPVHSNRPTRADFHELLRLGSPIILIQIGLMAMGVVDTLMVGRISAAALAAVALANLYTIGWSILGLGVLIALDPVVSQALGAQDEIAVRRAVQRGLVLALVLTVPTTMLYLAVEPVLEFVQQPPEVIPFAAGYVYRTSIAVFPFYAFIVLRQSLQAHRRTRPILITIVAANVVNALLNYVWIFGRLGFAELGVLGSAWATMVSRWLMAIFLLLLGWKYLRPYLTQLASRVFAPRAIGRMLAIGIPIGVQMMFEWGAFAAVALLMGWLGVSEVAAHQIALNLASLTFMVPLGVASAASVIVGHAVGRGDESGVRRSSLAALTVGVGFMAAMGAAFILFPVSLARLYTDSAEVLAVAVLLIPIAGVFQVFDGIQVVAMGLLRGLGDTRMPMAASMVGFWCIGIPISLWLAFVENLGGQGLWWGLVVGLAMVALFLLLRLRQHGERELVRLVVD